MKRLLGFLLGLAVFSSGLFIQNITAYAEEEYVPATFTIDRVEGKATAVNRVGHLTTLKTGTEVESGSVISTDKGSYVWITIDGYKHIKMDQSTEILVTHYKGNTDVTVNHGATLVTTDMKVPDGDHLHVRAGEMDTEVKGSSVLTEVSVFAKVETVFKKGSAGSSITAMSETSTANYANKSGGKIELIGKIGSRIMENGARTTVTQENGSDSASEGGITASFTALNGTIEAQYSENSSEAGSVTISQEKIATADLPLFVLTEIAEDNANGDKRRLAAKIKQDTGGRIDLTALTPDNIHDYSNAISDNSNLIQNADTLDEADQLEAWNKFQEELNNLIEQQKQEEALKAAELARIQSEERRALEEASKKQGNETETDNIGGQNSGNNQSSADPIGYIG